MKSASDGIDPQIRVVEPQLEDLQSRLEMAVNCDGLTSIESADVSRTERAKSRSPFPDEVETGLFLTRHRRTVEDKRKSGMGP